MTKIEKKADYAFIDQKKLKEYWKVLAKLKEADQNKIVECINMLHDNLEEQKETTLRALAESKNFQRRITEENSRMMKYANEEVLKDLLPIVDNFERAVSLDDNEGALTGFLSGFKMIYASIIELLNKNEVKEIPAEGLEFDPNYHQAVITEKDENKPAGVILEVLQKGYLYKDKVLRPAMVKVNE